MISAFDGDSAGIDTLVGVTWFSEIVCDEVALPCGTTSNMSMFQTFQTTRNGIRTGKNRIANVAILFRNDEMILMYGKKSSV